MTSYGKIRLYLCLIISLISLYIFSGILSKENNNKIQLGLDLSGGMSITIGIDADKYMSDKYSDLSNVIKKSLRHNNIQCSNFTYTKLNCSFKINNTILESKKITQYITDIDPDLIIKQMKNKIIIKYSDKKIRELSKYIVEQSRESISNRVDQYGTKEIIIQTLSGHKLLLQIPGVTDIQSVNNLLGKTAKLSFHMVGNETKKRDKSYSFLTFKTQKGEKSDASSKKNHGLYIKTKHVITGDLIEHANIVFDEYNRPIISLKFNSMGIKKFSDITKNNKGKQLAIVLDNKIVSAPTIQSHITNGQSVIQGQFSIEEASELVTLLRSGSLLAPLHILEQRISEATLGQESIDSSIKGGMIGFILVVLCMVCIYGWLGLVSIITILLTILYILSSMSLFGVVLTLPGIAGIILTIGITVDANVLINERIREERALYKGNIYTAFRHSLNTIVDSNITTLLVGIILYCCGYGAIKGFAIALCLGVGGSMFTSLTATVLLTSWMYRHVYKHRN